MIKSIIKIIKNKLINYNPSRLITGIENISGTKIHIGCGPVNLEGWINIDARPMDHIHMVTDSIQLEQFKEGSVGQIYMCHVLEHFNRQDVESLLKNYFNKLCKGGILRISVPDFDQIIETYKKSGQNVLLITPSILGGQDYEFNFHKIIFNKILLVQLLKDAGFTEILEWDTISDFGKDIGDWSTGELRDGLNFYPVSLNMKAIK